MNKPRSYYVDIALENGREGFYCYCFRNYIQVDKRFFSRREKAEEFGEEWISSKEVI